MNRATAPDSIQMGQPSIGGIETDELEVVGNIETRESKNIRG